jgi:hypothetical protein
LIFKNKKKLTDEDYATRRRRERAEAAAGLKPATDEPDWKASLRSRSVQVKLIEQICFS